jgi:hypothetical protein
MAGFQVSTDGHGHSLVQPLKFETAWNPRRLRRILDAEHAKIKWAEYPRLAATSSRAGTPLRNLQQRGDLKLAASPLHSHASRAPGPSCRVRYSAILARGLKRAPNIFPPFKRLRSRSRETVAVETLTP